MVRPVEFGSVVAAFMATFARQNATDRPTSAKLRRMNFGPLVLIVAMVVFIPVVLGTGMLLSMALGALLRHRAEELHPRSQYIGLNK